MSIADGEHPGSQAREGILRRFGGGNKPGQLAQSPLFGVGQRRLAERWGQEFLHAQVELASAGTRAAGIGIESVAVKVKTLALRISVNMEGKYVEGPRLCTADEKGPDKWAKSCFCGATRVEPGLDPVAPEIMTHCICTARIKSNSALSASVAANNKAARLGLLQARPDGWD